MEEQQKNQTTQDNTIQESELTKSIETLSLQGDNQLNNKHYLQNEWTLWYDNKKKSQDTFGESLKSVYTVTSVEDFWSLFNSVKQPSRFKTQNKPDLHLFKKGIKPTWEDPGNQGGGTLSILDVKNADMDELWKFCMLACISEGLEDENTEHICGCTVNVRKNSRIGLWLNFSNNEEALEKIKKRFNDFLELKNYTVSFTSHEEALKTTYTPSRNYR